MMLWAYYHCLFILVIYTPYDYVSNVPIAYHSSDML